MFHGLNSFRFFSVGIRIVFFFLKTFLIYETSVIISLPTSFEILVGRKDDDDENIIVRIFERYCVSVEFGFICRFTFCLPHLASRVQ
nr:MAG TPA: hypothetical protein [Caudoviricetes sp.]